jgi:hypothetical protein
VLDAGVRAANHYAKGNEMDPVKNVITPTPKASTQKRSNGQGSIYYVVNKQGRRILKAYFSQVSLLEYLQIKLELSSEIFRTEHESEFFDGFGIEDLV